MHRFGILLLAAGQSRRFGSDKLMAKMPDGRPVIAHSLEPLLAISKQHNIKISVISRADNHRLNDFLNQQNIALTLCPDAHLGMGHSIANGVKSHQIWQGWLIALADMPNITISLLNNLLYKIQQDNNEIIRPQLLISGKKIPAHPVYFPRRYGYALSKLTGDKGAKQLIQQQTLLTNINGESITEELLIDVDTQEILNTLHK